LAPPGRLQLVGAYLAVCLIWGSTYFAIRVALESYPPFFIGAVRFLFAGGVLYASARARGESVPRPKEWGSALAVGALFFLLGNGLITAAERSVSSGLASVVVATVPLWTTVFARILGQRVSPGEVGGVVLGMVGVAVLNANGELRASPAGAALLFLAPVAWALGSIVSPRLSLPTGTMRVAAPMLAGGVMLLVASLAQGEDCILVPSLRSLVAVAYLALFGSLLAFSAYSLLLRHTRPMVATSYAFVNPVIAVVLGTAFGHEEVGAANLVGSLLVLSAVVLGAAARSAAVRRPEGSGPKREPVRRPEGSGPKREPVRRPEGSGPKGGPASESRRRPLVSASSVLTTPRSADVPSALTTPRSVDVPSAPPSQQVA
jgi:drug/metabolite transporter (DMT)-like permease